MSRKVSITNSCVSTKQFGLLKVNQYTLLNVLGCGAYGEVFQAIEPAQGLAGGEGQDKIFAIKKIKKEYF
jgi:serine/threonine protein kinase